MYHFLYSLSRPLGELGQGEGPRLLLAPARDVLVSQESFKHHSFEWRLVAMLASVGALSNTAGLPLVPPSIKGVALMSWRILLLAMVAVEEQSRSKEGK